MQVTTINSPKPEIRFHASGLIDVSAVVFRKLNLSGDKKISFVFDEENNLHIRKDSEGISPSSARGNFLRYHSVEVTKAVLSHPDVPCGLNRVAFRTGQVENDLLPVITRRIIKD
jgi:hypothetical protein